MRMRIRITKDTTPRPAEGIIEGRVFDDAFCDASGGPRQPIWVMGDLGRMLILFKGEYEIVGGQKP
jgi:hypothetical protein